MLDKQISFDHSISELGHIQVRQITRIMEDGKEIGKTYHRHVVNPGDDIANQDERTIKIALAIHTPEVVAPYKAKLVENESKQKNNT